MAGNGNKNGNRAAPDHCEACGRHATDVNPLVLVDGTDWVHRSHTTDPRSGYFRTVPEE